MSRHNKDIGQTGEKEAVNYLLGQENCAIVIVACNTSSARALRKIQVEYLPKKFPDRKVLGVLIPAAELAAAYDRVGVLATVGTVASNTFPMEIKKLNSGAVVFQNPAPMLVSLIEEGNLALAKKFLSKYLKPFIDKKLDALVLGCTHYPLLKSDIRKIMPKKVKIISQDEIISRKLKEYLTRHSEISKKLSDNGTMKISVTSQTKNVNHLVKKWFGRAKIDVISSSLLSS